MWLRPAVAPAPSITPLTAPALCRPAPPRPPPHRPARPGLQLAARRRRAGPRAVPGAAEKDRQRAARAAGHRAGAPLPLLLQRVLSLPLLLLGRAPGATNFHLWPGPVSRLGAAAGDEGAPQSSCLPARLRPHPDRHTRTTTHTLSPPSSHARPKAPAHPPALPRPLPLRQVARQEGQYLAQLLSQHTLTPEGDLPEEAQPFVYNHKGSAAYVGAGGPGQGGRGGAGPRCAALCDFYPVLSFLKGEKR